jgi:hypothetical protein
MAVDDARSEMVRRGAVIAVTVLNPGCVRIAFATARAGANRQNVLELSVN